MREYLNTLVITMIVSQLCIQLTPSMSDSKKYVKLVCSLSVFICLFLPITTAIRNGNEFIDAIKSFISPIYVTEGVEEKFINESAAVMTYISDNYNISKDSIKVTVITDDTDSDVVELHIYIKGVACITGDKIESVLVRELQIPVYVFLWEDT